MEIENGNKGEKFEGLERKIKNSIYVKKWMRTKHAIMFRLSNKIVQVSFQDHTEVILCSENKEVTYVNKKGERMTYPLATALESKDTEMAKRLKYAKDILTHMLSTTKNENQEKKESNKAGKVAGNFKGNI